MAKDKDHTLAFKVQTARKALNNAIHEAVTAGLEVNVDIQDFERVGSPNYRRVEISISRPIVE